MDTIITTITSTVSKITTNTPTSTVATYPGFVPATSAQASQLTSLAADYPNKKRSFDSRSLNKGSYGGAIGAHQISVATVVPNALYNNTASPPASTTETISATITTSSLAGTITSTVVQTTTTTATVQAAGAEATTYAACQSNNLITTVKDSNYPINDLGAFLTFSLELGIAVATSASSAYACFCSCRLDSGDCGGGLDHSACTATCYLFPDNGDCSPTMDYCTYSSCSADDGQEYTGSSADCGVPLLTSPCS